MANISAIKVGSTSYGITPASHASTATTYGAATDSNYGHVKLSDNYTSSAGAASSGIGASSLAVYNAYNTLNSNKVHWKKFYGVNNIKITVPMDYNESTVASGATHYLVAHPSFIVMWSCCKASAGFSGTQIFQGNGFGGVLTNSIGNAMSGSYGIDYTVSTSGNNRIYTIKASLAYNEVTIFYPSSITVQ